ncbi:hypothetical protein NDU88_009902 [Pleurodeles waltl]|uniref:Uncharacterized protein n=1 Tax=Pleurodeles waltl TaxID=8319 RepID=A0AAV7PWN5_PLEWA|nr:hypothetical protein NDU88_009902 [Pleurodeles waltl]
MHVLGRHAQQLESTLRRLTGSPEHRLRCLSSLCCLRFFDSVFEYKYQAAMSHDKASYEKRHLNRAAKTSAESFQLLRLGTFLDVLLRFVIEQPCELKRFTERVCCRGLKRFTELVCCRGLKHFTERVCCRGLKRFAERVCCRGLKRFTERVRCCGLERLIERVCCRELKRFKTPCSFCLGEN